MSPSHANKWIHLLPTVLNQALAHYAARTASERTNSYNQEMIDHGRPPKLRGLKAFRISGAIRTVAHLLHRALTCILDVTYTLGQREPVKT